VTENFDQQSDIQNTFILLIYRKNVKCQFVPLTQIAALLAALCDRLGWWHCHCKSVTENK
jgi:hypothetical protein